MSNDLNGNGLLTRPIGLITADEAVFAGVPVYSENKNYYLYSGDTYWTLTPSYFNSGDRTVILSISNVGLFNDMEISSSFGVRPVINLKADVEFTGTGTIDDPYVILTD